MNNKIILQELEERAETLTQEAVSGNKSVTVISSGDKKFFEPAFSGCGSVHWSLPKSDWRIAKELGFKKCYRDYQFGGQYYNGQFGDACRAYGQALSELRVKYPNSILEKVSLDSWID